MTEFDDDVGQVIMSGMSGTPTPRHATPRHATPRHAYLHSYSYVRTKVSDLIPAPPPPPPPSHPL